MENKTKIYRKKTCPWGEKAITLLKQKDISFEDHIFASKDEEEDFKAKHQVKTTPQIFVEGTRVGGYTNLAEKYNVKVNEEDDEKSYTPVIAVFLVAEILNFATTNSVMGFMGFSLSLLALLKLMDLKSFSTCLLYTSPSPRDATLSRMPSSA